MVKGRYESQYEIFETKLIGIEALWELIFTVRDEAVYKRASTFLHRLYKKLSPTLAENLNPIKEEFLQTCMEAVRSGYECLQGGAALDAEVREDSKNRVARAISAICTFIDDFEGLRGRRRN